MGAGIQRWWREPGYPSPMRLEPEFAARWARVLVPDLLVPLEFETLPAQPQLEMKIRIDVPKPIPWCGIFWLGDDY